MGFIKEKDFQGRLLIFLNFVMCKVLKRDLARKERDKISFIVVDRQHIELKYEDNYIGVVKLVEMTTDFIFKQ